MRFKRFIKKERRIWHKHFIPSLLAAIIVGGISYLYDTTISNVILFSSVGASAMILTNSKTHHLTRLHTIIFAYIVTLVISILLYGFNSIFELHISVNIALMLFLVGITLFLVDSFHPPAITAALAFILLDQGILDLIYLFIAILLLLISVRFATYVISQRLSPRKFFKEFKKSF